MLLHNDKKGSCIRFYDFHKKFFAELLTSFQTKLTIRKTRDLLKSSLLLTDSQLSTSKRESKSGGAQMTEIVKCEVALVDFCTLTESVKWCKTVLLILELQIWFQIVPSPRAHEWAVCHCDVALFLYPHICPLSFPSTDLDGLVTHTWCQAHKSASIPPQWHLTAINRSPGFNHKRLPTDSVWVPCCRRSVGPIDNLWLKLLSGFVVFLIISFFRWLACTVLIKSLGI